MLPSSRAASRWRNAALHFAAGNGFEFVVSAPCDTPALDDVLLGLLLSAGGNAFPVDMPVIGCSRSDGASLLEAHLGAADEHSMRAWTRLVGAVPLEHPAPLNINRRVDLDLLDGR